SFHSPLSTFLLIRFSVSKTQPCRSASRPQVSALRLPSMKAHGLLRALHSRNPKPYSQSGLSAFLLIRFSVSTAQPCQSASRPQVSALRLPSMKAHGLLRALHSRNPKPYSQSGLSAFLLIRFSVSKAQPCQSASRPQVSALRLGFHSKMYPCPLLVSMAFRM